MGGSVPVSPGKGRQTETKDTWEEIGMVSSARSLFTWGTRRFGEELADLETALQADRICAGEQKVQREDLKSESWI
jgi:hypothetical protein